MYRRYLGREEEDEGASKCREKEGFSYLTTLRAFLFFFFCRLVGWLVSRARARPYRGREREEEEEEEE